MNNQEKIVVIGGGLAGLASAIRLRRNGYRVLVLEKNNDLGGKLGEYRWNDYRWDKGPSLFTLPEQVVELLDRPNDFEFKKLVENCRYFFPDGSRTTMFTDKQKREIALKRNFNSEEVEQIEKYIKDADETYKGFGSSFIDHPKISYSSFLRKDLIPHYPNLLKGSLRKSLHEVNQSRFSNRKLVQLFDRFGTYNGSNPYKMSGLFQMISSLELNGGTYFPVNGMRSIIDSLKRSADKIGVDFLYGLKNIKAKQDKGKFVISNNGNEIFVADKLVCAIDHLAFYKDVLQDESSYYKYAKQERSSSGLVFYWAVDKKFPEIGLHNIIFSDDYENEFKSIFESKEIYWDPTIYIHNSSVVSKNDAPPNGQNWFVMINTPSGLEPDENQIEEIKSKIINKLKDLHKFDISDHIIHEHHWTMKGIEQDTGSVQGAIYGASSNGKLASIKRHGNKVKKYKNLYFCGGTVHPGGGIPLVLKSAKMVEELIVND